MWWGMEVIIEYRIIDMEMLRIVLWVELRNNG